jgi:hypothetical protein
MRVRPQSMSIPREMLDDTFDFLRNKLREKSGVKESCE